MKKMILYVGAIIVILAITIIFLLFADAGDAQNNVNIKFLKSYNWQVDKNYIEKEELIIPKEFDDVYKNYNELQLDAGLDLTAYKGQCAVRYTYKVTNYPEEVGEIVRANVLVVNGKPIAGDIMTVSIGGFMHSLRYPEK